MASSTPWLMNPPPFGVVTAAAVVGEIVNVFVVDVALIVPAALLMNSIRLLVPTCPPWIVLFRLVRVSLPVLFTPKMRSLF